MNNKVSPYLQRPVRSLEKVQAETGRTAMEQRDTPATQPRRPATTEPPAADDA